MNTYRILALCSLLLLTANSPLTAQWDINWETYADAPLDQEVQGPCLGYANSLMISTQYRIERGLMSSCAAFSEVQRPSPLSLYFFGVDSNEDETIYGANYGSRFRNRYEGGHLIPFRGDFMSPGTLSDDCWFQLDDYGLNTNWTFANIEKGAILACEFEQEEHTAEVNIQNTVTSGAKVAEYRNLSVANRANITEALRSGPIVLKVKEQTNTNNLDLLSDKYTADEPVLTYHGVLILGIEHLDNLKFRLRIADSWPGAAEIYTSKIIENTALNSSLITAWGIGDVSYFPEAPCCEQTVLSFGPTSNELLTLNHPNRFRIQLADPGVPLNEWVITVTGGTFSSLTGSPTNGYFYVTPTSRSVQVNLSLPDCDGNMLTIRRFFRAGSRREDDRGGRFKSNEEEQLTVRLNDRNLSFSLERFPPLTTYQLSVFDVNGRQMLNTPVPDGATSLRRSINAPAGIYFVRLYHLASQQVITQKVIL